MNHLAKLENQSIYIIREAYAKYKNIALLWSVGKDSTALLWLIKKAFYNHIPFPVIHLDTTYKFKDIYDFRDQYAKEWNLNLIVVKNSDALRSGMNYSKGRFECCTELKTNALKLAIEKYGLKALYLAIRRDEHGIRAKERIFSSRGETYNWDYKNQQPELWEQYKAQIGDKGHLRVHPMLGWTEIDIWEYTQKENIPSVPLYFSKDGNRYRSIGCECCCGNVKSKAGNIDEIIEELKTTQVSERAGRIQDKESANTMQKLRSLGYM